MSHTAEFPARTAGELTLPGGTTVWIQTLNTLLKEQADGKARRYAANESRPMLKGGRDYPAVLAEIRSFDPDKQALYLAQQEYWSIHQEAVGKHPDPQEPQQGEQDGETYAKTLQKWEEDCRSAQAKRLKFEESRHAAEVKKALALTQKVREERCVTAYINQQWADQFIKRLSLETLLRAVRLADDHTQRYFACVEDVEDADDAVFQALHQFYFHDLDTVKPDEIPTSPAVSS